MAIVRLVAVIPAIEALLYVLIVIHLRSSRVETPEDRRDRRHPDRAGVSLERRRFARRSMAGYGKSLHARMVWLILALPPLAVVMIIYVVNFD